MVLMLSAHPGHRAAECNGTRMLAPMSEEPGTGWSGLIDTARRIGHHVWIERQLFAWLGAWAGGSGAAPIDPAATVFLGEQAGRHGRHAEVLFARLPQLRELEPEGLVVARDEATAAFVRALVAPGDPDRLLEALVDHYRVLLPALVASYRALLADASPVADASLIRSLGMLLDDDVDELGRGENLLSRLLTDPDELHRASDRQRESQAVLLGSQLSSD